MQPSSVPAQIRRRLPRAGSFRAYAIAVGLVVTAILLRLPLNALSAEPLPPFLTLYPALVLSAVIGGVRVGFFAMALSAVAGWVLWMGPHTDDLSLGHVVTGFVFLATGALTTLTSGMARVLLDDVLESEDARTHEARESVHRIKNLLAVVQAMSQRVRVGDGDVAGFRKQLDARLAALARAQDLLLDRPDRDASLDDVIKTALDPFLPSAQLRLTVADDPAVPRDAVTPLSMALYELATNSLKYGALGSVDGIVQVDTQIVGDRCHLHWVETGFAPIAQAPQRGFGSQLIRAALRQAPGGVVRYDVSSSAVSCAFEWDAPQPTRR